MPVVYTDEIELRERAIEIMVDWLPERWKDSSEDRHLRDKLIFSGEMMALAESKGLGNIKSKRSYIGFHLYRIKRVFVPQANATIDFVADNARGTDKEYLTLVNAGTSETCSYYYHDTSEHEIAFRICCIPGGCYEGERIYDTYRRSGVEQALSRAIAILVRRKTKHGSPFRNRQGQLHQAGG